MASFELMSKFEEFELDVIESSLAMCRYEIVTLRGVEEININILHISTTG